MSRRNNPSENIFYRIIQAKRDGVFLRKLANKFYHVIIAPPIKAALYLAPISQNKIVFSNFGGKGYGDNPKYIAEKLISLCPSYDFVWLTSNLDDVFPKNVRAVKYGSLASYYEWATARVWIDNMRNSDKVRKKKGQYYVQTWHGSLGIKKIERDAKDQLSNGYWRQVKNDSIYVDLMISNGDWFTTIARRAFDYHGEIIESGSPKFDILFNCTADERNKIRCALGIPIGVKVAIYAPTFRSSKSLDVYNLPYAQVKSALEERFGGEWVIINRLHPNISDLKIQANFDFVYDATRYPDVNELLMISDILITDYSSTMFQLGIILKPVFLFATDIKAYKDERGWYFSINELPFSLAENGDELLDNISLFNLDEYQKNVKAFLDKIGAWEDGHASERVANRILKELESSKHESL